MTSQPSPQASAGASHLVPEPHFRPACMDVCVHGCVGLCVHGCVCVCMCVCLPVPQPLNLCGGRRLIIPYESYIKVDLKLT